MTIDRHPLPRADDGLIEETAALNGHVVNGKESKHSSMLPPPVQQPSLSQSQTLKKNPDKANDCHVSSYLAKPLVWTSDATTSSNLEMLHSSDDDDPEPLSKIQSMPTLPFYRRSSIPNMNRSASRNDLSSSKRPMTPLILETEPYVPENRRRSEGVENDPAEQNSHANWRANQPMREHGYQRLNRDDNFRPKSLVDWRRSTHQQAPAMHDHYYYRSSRPQLRIPRSPQPVHYMHPPLRDPERENNSGHKLLNNFYMNPMVTSERMAVSSMPHYIRPKAEGSWNAIEPQPSGFSKRVFDKGVVDIHDFRPIRVIGKGSYGKVILVENKHYDDAQRSKLTPNQQLLTSSYESSLFRDTLSWMSNRNWRKPDQHKFMGEAEGCHRFYAIKVLNREVVIKKQQTTHTMTENQVLKYLDHSMIIDMHFAFKTPTKLFMVLEYCPGGELFHHLSEVGIFSEDKAKFYASCVLLAIEEMHSCGVVYRDLKPENIVMDSTGYIRLTDFGLAKANIRDNHSAKSVCGTPEYLAPEVLMAQGHGLSVDHWGLAALIFEMLTGLPPFYSKKREELLEGIRKGVLAYPVTVGPVAKDLMQRLFVKDPKNRLGAHNIQEIFRHPFFADVDWEGLKSRTAPPPFVPKINSPFDTSNFDTEFTNLNVERFDNEDCTNPAHEDPFTTPLSERRPDQFFDWYFDKRYPSHYFTADYSSD